MSRRPGILAVDGGGSKIDAVLLRRDGTVLGAARTRTQEDEGSGSDGHMGQVIEAIVAACRDAGVSPEPFPVADVGVYCLAGADLPADDRRIERWLRARGITAENLVRNDTFAVLRAGTDRSWGVGVVCGAGTNCSAVSPEGRVARFPAVGSISGDWGGGWDVGGTALWYAIRAQDGRGEKTALARVVPEHFGFRRPRQVLEAMYFHRLDEERVVELPPVVFRAATEGDAIARSIVDRQADEVVAFATTSIRRLRMTELDVDVVLGGGIFHNDDDLFFKRIHEGVWDAAPAARIRVLTDPPVIGAALLGLDHLGAHGAAHRRARRTLTHERLRPDTRAKE